MIVIASGFLGAFLGVKNARKREGNRLDMAQHGAAYAIVFMIVAVFLTILLERLVA